MTTIACPERGCGGLKNGPHAPTCILACPDCRGNILGPHSPGCQYVEPPLGGKIPQKHGTKTPARYLKPGAVECIDAMEAAACNYEDPGAGLLAAQVIRYIWRAQQKNGVDDLDKAIDYARRLRARLDGRPGTWDRP